MTDQKRAGKSAKSVQDLKMLGHFSKSDIRYWQGAVFRQTYTRNGRSCVTKDWAMKVAHEGRRETFPLGTPNKAAAAARASDIYFSLVAVAWEPTLARFKKPKAAAPAAKNEQQCTVGEFLDAVAEAETNRSTVEGYAKKFRQIVSEIFGPFRWRTET